MSEIWLGEARLTSIFFILSPGNVVLQLLVFLIEAEKLKTLKNDKCRQGREVLLGGKLLSWGSKAFFKIFSFPGMNIICFKIFLKNPSSPTHGFGNSQALSWVELEILNLGLARWLFTSSVPPLSGFDQHFYIWPEKVFSMKDSLKLIRRSEVLPSLTACWASMLAVHQLL